MLMNPLKGYTGAEDSFKMRMVIFVALFLCMVANLLSVPIKEGEAAEFPLFENQFLIGAFSLFAYGILFGFVAKAHIASEHLLGYFLAVCSAGAVCFAIFCFYLIGPK